ncbi:hypothetical protein CANARDRAFT_5608 [[Candida] arabinofermentans NRRL YB-2248]|uniref:Uncharacterized protein n=1 Tax=[Candida] arabinofermentans NRRL YB-2248 TaxID=983967 RepID=A0A1E4T5L9_9ASCO|nr:hypothetical protein CANARDRAFT_5608 [[Candida] arabinofermentans NRRL YB-2248]
MITTQPLYYPDNVMNLIVSNIDNTRDLLSLSRVTKYTNYYANKKLFRHVLLSSEQILLKTIGFDDYLQSVTILPLNKLNQFVSALSQNITLISFVQKVFVGAGINNLEGITLLANLLMDFKVKNQSVPLLGLKEFKFLNQCSSTTFISLNKELMSIKSGTTSPRYHMLYENDEDEINRYNGHNYDENVFALNAYQIRSLHELSYLPLETEGLSVNVKRQYESSNVSLTENLHQIFSKLRSLELATSESATLFFNCDFSRSVVFENLTRISLNLNNLNLIDAISSCIQFQNLECFELKFKQPTIQEWDCEINLTLIDFFHLNFSKLRKLSLIHLNSNNLLNNSSVLNQYSFKESNLSFCLLNNFSAFNNDQCSIKYLNISMNNFSLLPPISKEFKYSKTHFIVDNYYLRSKLNLFSKLLTMSSLETLIIPDYFFNWKPFIKLQSNGELLQNDKVETTNYLFENCSCTDCHHSRTLIQSYTANFKFTEDKLSSVYNFVVGMLFKRLPTFEQSSGLDTLKYPFHNSVEISNYGYLNIDLSSLVRLMLDNMVDDLKFFVAHFSFLKSLCLGGILIDVSKSENLIKLSAVYDSWECKL